MNPPNISAMFRAVSRWLITVAALATVIFWLPLTPDALEFPKQYLLAALVIPSLIFWLLSGITSNPKRFLIRRTSFDYALIGVLLVTFISSILSDERMTSIFGDHNAMTFSFLSLALYALVYFLIVQTHDVGEERRLTVMVMGGMVVLSGLFIARSLFPDWTAWLGIPGNSSFSAFASQFSLAAGVGVVLMLGRLMHKETSPASQAALVVGLLVCLTAVTMVGFRISWILLAVGLVMLLMYAVTKMNELKMFWVSVTMCLFVPVLLFIFIGTPQFVTVSLPIEVTVGNGISWDIGRSVMTSNVLHFLFGAGPATFPIQFSRYRTPELNTTFAWNVRFDHPSSAAFAILSDLGVIGSLAVLVLMLIGVGVIFPAWVARNSSVAKRSGVGVTPNIGNEFWGIAAAWTMITVAFFLLPFNTSLWVMWFTMTALLALHARSFMGSERMVIFNLKTSPQYGLVMSFAFIVAFTGFVSLFTVLARHFMAEVAYARGLTAIAANNLDVANTELNSAVGLNAWRAEYRLSLAQSYLGQAVKASQADVPDPNIITRYLADAVNESKRASEISPLRVSTWEQLALMYGQARTVAPEATGWGISALEQAIQLEETNPIFHVLLGNLRLASDQRELARESYQRAIALKPDLVDAYMNLSIVEEMDGNMAEAVAQAERAVQVAPTNPDARFQLGRMYFNRNAPGDLANARTVFVSVLEIDPNNANALFSLGTVSERERKISEAITWFERLQALDTSNTDVRKKLQDLRLGVTTPAPSLPTTTPLAPSSDEE